MGTQLNIKDARTVELARKLADASGRSVTETIRTALERELAEHNAGIATRRDAILASVADFQKIMPDEWRGRTSKEIMDAIYDEDGLPR